MRKFTKLRLSFLSLIHYLLKTLKKHRFISYQIIIKKLIKDFVNKIKLILSDKSLNRRKS